MRFADIRQLLLDEWTPAESRFNGIYILFKALNTALILLAEQERIREAVPVREPGPTLEEQLAVLRELIAAWKRFVTPAGTVTITPHSAKCLQATLERLAREDTP